MDNFIETIFPFLFGAVFLYLAFNFIRKKGFRGMMFGAEVIDTIGEVQCEKRHAMSTTIKIHTLKPTSGSNNNIGIELITKSFASYHMTPFTLSLENAKVLAELINEATNN